MFNFRRRETPWEVVDSSVSVEPVPMYYEDEGEVTLRPVVQYAHQLYVDLDIDYVGDNDTTGTYLFDVRRVDERSNFRNALLFSRQLLLQEVAKRDFNVLLLERYCDSFLSPNPLS
jgi:hypothetical protein